MAFVGASLMFVIIILSILLIFGLPLGELTMGGKYRVIPHNLRILLVIQLVLQVFLLSLFCRREGISLYGFPIMSHGSYVLS